jgi:hypothetical protein
MLAPPSGGLRRAGGRIVEEVIVGAGAECTGRRDRNRLPAEALTKVRQAQ